MPQNRDLKLYTEDQVWKFVTQAITRVLYDAIATHEAHGEHSIEVGWLRAVSYTHLTLPTKTIE